MDSSVPVVPPFTGDEDTKPPYTVLSVVNVISTRCAALLVEPSVTSPNVISGRVVLLYAVHSMVVLAAVAAVSVPSGV